MAKEAEHGTTLEECEAAGGKRLPKSKRRGLRVLVEHFLEGVMLPPEGMEKKSQRKQDLIWAEVRGYNKAQENLREVIAMGGTEALADLAEVRDERQMRPTMIGHLRTWIGP